MLSPIAQQLGHILQARQEAVATAESCTGGGIAAALTDIAGSSAWFDRGFVTYSNLAKTQQLGVPAELLERFGAVSEQAALAMALGAIAHSVAHWSVAVTGIAGPGGGSADKPVGLVWFGFADQHKPQHKPQPHQPEPRVWAVRQQFAGDRQAVRAAAVAFALTQLLQAVQVRGG